MWRMVAAGKLNLARSPSVPSPALRSEVRGIPVFKKNDMRYEEANKHMQQAIAKERLAFANVERAKLDLARLPPAPDILHLPIEDGGVPRAEDLRELLTKLEDKIREGAAIYIFSRCGHGRAGEEDMHAPGHAARELAHSVLPWCRSDRRGVFAGQALWLSIGGDLGASAGQLVLASGRKKRSPSPESHTPRLSCTAATVVDVVHGPRATMTHRGVC